MTRPNTSRGDIVGLLTIADSRGNVIAEPIHAIDDRDRAICAELLEPFLAECAELGIPRIKAMFLIAEFAIMDSRDHAAYERVCERKGLLPL